MEPFRSRLARALAPLAQLDPEETAAMLEIPPNPEMGDLAFPCFKLARTFRTAPPQIAQELASRFEKPDFVSAAEATGPYVNFHLSAPALAAHIIPKVLMEGDCFAAEKARGERIVIDYSSPNIAKPFSIGHLRSTMVGHALVEHLRHFGYEVIGVNHLGDWGTQFGMVMAGYERWGTDRPLQDVDVRFLLDLYVRFNREAKDDPEKDAEAREWFRRLESGDARARELWQVFREVSLEEARRIYGRLGVEFQYYTGESFYNDRLSDTIARLEARGLLVESQGARVVDLSDDEIPPCLIQKSDGATLYATRDLSAAIYRMEEFNPARVLYVVGTPQKLHFRQLFRVLEKLEPSWSSKFVHVDFGHYRLAEGKMQTRTGNVVFMEDVLDRGVEMALEIMREAVRGGDLEEAESAAVAEQVALGAIVFGDLTNDRIKDVVFDWEKALDFKGDTGPYIQYTRARIASILRKADAQSSDSAHLADVFDGMSWAHRQQETVVVKPSARLLQRVFGDSPSHRIDWERLSAPEEKALLLLLLQFPATLSAAVEHYKPSFTANYLLDLARAFGTFYNQHPVLKSDPELRDARLTLCAAVGTLLGLGLKLLGIPIPERM